MEAYIVKFENGKYWKGQGCQLTPNIENAATLRQCDLNNKWNMIHIKEQVERKFGLKEPRIVKIEVCEVETYGVEHYDSLCD